MLQKIHQFHNRLHNHAEKGPTLLVESMKARVCLELRLKYYQNINPVRFLNKIISGMFSVSSCSEMKTGAPQSDLGDTFYWPIVDCQSLLSYWRRVLDIYQSTWPSDHSTFNIQHFMFKYPAYSHRQAVGRVTITRDASGVDTLFVLTIICWNRIFTR